MRFYVLFILDTAFGWQNFLSPQQMKTAGILPWIGVLKVRSGNTEYATGLILIADRLAAVNSNDISKLDKETLRMSSRAVFFKHNVPWYCDVKDYQIHPEFHNVTLTNTLAILNLDCDRKVWTPVNLPGLTPTNNVNPNFRVWRNIYAIGLSDRNYDFEQIIFKMKFVNSSKCLDFYFREEIDFKALWPKHFFCFKGVNVKKQCVFDSGMALVSLNNGNWTLIGISVLGPGCVLPSRYVDITPYIAWMNKQKNKHMLNYRRQLKEGSDENKNKKTINTAIDPSKDIVSDSSIIEDFLNLKTLNTMVMRPCIANESKIAYGNCSHNQGIVLYRDAGLIRTSNMKPATGHYSLSLYDLFYDEITCVMVSIECNNRSLAEYWFQTGFKADSLDDFIKTVPYHKRGEGVPPQILFLKDSLHNYRDILTANIAFKFEFTGEAAISVDFYGTLVPRIRRSTTTKTTTSRPRKKYPYHMHNTRAPKRRKLHRTKKRFDRKILFPSETN